MHATYVPLGALGMTIFSIDLFFASRGVVRVGGEELMGVAAFLQSPANWRVLVDLTLVAVAGGSLRGPAQCLAPATQ